MRRKRHCLVVSFNSSTTDVKAFTRAAAAVAAKRRLLRVVLVDGKHGALSSAKGAAGEPGDRALRAAPEYKRAGRPTSDKCQGPEGQGGFRRTSSRRRPAARPRSRAATRTLPTSILRVSVSGRATGGRGPTRRDWSSGGATRTCPTRRSRGAWRSANSSAPNASYAAAHPLVRLGDTTYTHGAKAFRGVGFDGAAARRVALAVPRGGGGRPRVPPARPHGPREARQVQGDLLKTTDAAAAAGAAARAEPRRRGAAEERDRQKERAERERERREQMDAAGADLFETVEVGADGEATAVEEEEDEEDDETRTRRTI